MANIHKELNSKDPCHWPPYPPSLPPPTSTLQVYLAVCLMDYRWVMLQKQACWEVHQHSVLSWKILWIKPEKAQYNNMQFKNHVFGTILNSFKSNLSLILHLITNICHFLHWFQKHYGTIFNDQEVSDMYNKSHTVWCFSGAVLFVQFGGKGGYSCHRPPRPTSSAIGHRRAAR